MSNVYNISWFRLTYGDDDSDRDEAEASEDDMEDEPEEMEDRKKETGVIQILFTPFRKIILFVVGRKIYKHLRENI